MQTRVAIVGGGLAGCEAARALARRGMAVTLYEMKPAKRSAAHVSPHLAELVCSNSLRSDEPATGVGLLKEEMRALGSLVLEAAHATRVPAGKALAVDREAFAAAVTRAIEDDPAITVVHEEIPSLDDARLTGFDAVVIAAGPLASEGLSASLAAAVGAEHLHFYDAIAPIIDTDSVDMDHAFWASRYNPEEKDYLNCPMTEAEYEAFHSALLSAETVPTLDFERHFEGCMPIEALAARGPQTLTFGPMKPVGLEDPATGKRAYAVLQLRPENADKSALNLVGCQTKMRYPEQKRVFGLAPALREAEFLRFGSMHRNTFVNAPEVLADGMALRARPGVYLAGQITGVEGYVESAAHGLWVGLALAARLTGRTLGPPPPVTALGGLLGHLTTAPAKEFQPSNCHFGLLPGLEKKMKKKDRKAAYAQRAQEAFAAWTATMGGA